MFKWFKKKFKERVDANLKRMRIASEEKENKSDAKDRAEMYEYLLRNHNKGLSCEYLKFMMQSELSDIIFEQHMKTYMPFNIFIIAVQLALVITSVIVQIVTNIRVAFVIAMINLGLCIFVVVNNAIHSKQWAVAKKRLHSLDIGFDILQNRSKEELIDTLVSKYKIDLSNVVNDAGEIIEGDINQNEKSN